MFRLLKYLKPYKVQSILAPFAKFVETAAEISLPFLMAIIIDKMIPAGDTAGIIRLSVIMGIISIVGFIFCLTCQYLAAVSSMGFGAGIRRAMMRKIAALSHDDLDSFGTPSLVNRMTNDVSNVQLAVAMTIRLVMRAPFMCIGGIVMTMILDVRLSMILLIFIPIFALVILIVMRKNVPVYKSAQRRMDKTTMVLRENIQGVRVVRAFNESEGEKEHFESANDRYAKTAVRAGRIGALLSPATTLIMNFAVLAVVWFGGIRIVNTEDTLFTAGKLIAFISYLTQIMMSMLVFANQTSVYTKASASAFRINQLLDARPSMHSPAEGLREGKPGAPTLVFKDVSFSYSGDNNALSDISFTAERGEVVGIIGGTGAGKSTLVNLIPRFYDCNSGGRVLVDGVSVDKYDLTVLRDKIGMVPQKAVLFDGTVADNLRWGKADATEAEMEAACRAAQSWDFVERLPHGLDEPVSQGGKNFSGGQKQRLTIARALIKKPEILILDDAASALDYATDARLRVSLRETFADTTVIIVSQRVSAVRTADKIIVLSEGRMVGLGAHDNLLETCDIYREIYESQNRDRGGRDPA